MKAGICPSQAELSRAYLDGAAASLRTHLERCSSCQAQWDKLDKLDELRTLARQLPATVPDAAHRSAMRAALLAKLEPLPTRSPVRMVPARWLWVSGAVAAAACLFLLLRPWNLDRPSVVPTSFRAMVQLQGPAAHFVHERSGGDERVQLSSGQLFVEVAPLQKGERFRVLCKDGEVEVRGTAFEVEAANDQLVGVHVFHGRVEVRPSGGRTLLLGAGERWTAGPAIPAEPAAPPRQVAAPVVAQGRGASTRTQPLPEPVPPIAPHQTLLAARPSARASVPAAPLGRKPVLTAPAVERVTGTGPQGMSAAERAFDDGWAAMQRSEFGVAAQAFSCIESAAGSESIVEDARFWRAVALGRAGQSQAETDALLRFLSLHPRSSRAGEAAAILGWLLVKQGHLDEANLRFQAAAKDSRQEVRQSALAGLANLAARRPNAIVPQTP